jgi:hypothetical protein
MTRQEQGVEMSKTVLAKDAKAGQWYRSERYGIMLSCMGLAFWTPLTETVDIDASDELTHLPDCTGWDWEPPKPEKKYRAFATLREWWPHRERWFRDAGGAALKGWLCDVHASALFEQGAVFLNDDGTDAEPFGVEVSE